MVLLTTFKSKAVVGILTIFSVSSLAAEIARFRGHPFPVGSNVRTIELGVAAGVSLAVIGLLLRDSGTRIERFVLAILAFEVVRKFAMILLRPRLPVEDDFLIKASSLIGVFNAAALLICVFFFLTKIRNSAGPPTQGAN